MFDFYEFSLYIFVMFLSKYPCFRYSFLTKSLFRMLYVLQCTSVPMKEFTERKTACPSAWFSFCMFFLVRASVLFEIYFLYGLINEPRNSTPIFELTTCNLPMCKSSPNSDFRNSRTFGTIDISHFLSQLTT